MHDNVEDTYREEASDLIAELESVLLELESQPEDPALVDSVFRALHTIKGGAAMFGFEPLAEFTHHLENAFELVRAGEMEVSTPLVSLTFQSLDHITQLLEHREGSESLLQQSEALLNQLAELVPDSLQEGVATYTETADTAEVFILPGEEGAENKSDSPGTSARPTEGAAQAKQKKAEPKLYRIQLHPAKDTFRDGLDPLPILRELKGLGECWMKPLVAQVPDLPQIDPETCYMDWTLLLRTTADEAEIRDAFIFVEDEWQFQILVLQQQDETLDPEACARLGDILVSRGDVTQAELSEALDQQKRLGELMVASQKIDPEQLDCALAEQEMVRATQQARTKTTAARSVKVPAARLDTLMDLVGELVIAQARLNQCAMRLSDGDLMAVAESIERLTTELRENSLSLRMLPIGTTFGRFRRLVRDLAGDLGKEIELITNGAETELDKTIIDRLADPIVHLIRNAIDHGIELPDAREAKGKSRKGTVKLSAAHSESHVVITIVDDGKGMDVAAIRARAIERQVIAEEDVMSDSEIFDLVFEPGFSTAQTVSNISGRGVGMDVVKRSIEDLRGMVSISSQPESGSTIRIEIPLTLAIIEGLLVGVAQERYVLPLSLVEECIELPRMDANRASTKRTVEVRGELVPFVRLSEWFELESSNSDIEQVVLVKVGESRFGFVVDEVIGQHQTVIKALGKVYEGVQGISGATILGDGSVALIIEAAKLIESLRQSQLGLDYREPRVAGIAC